MPRLKRKTLGKIKVKNAFGATLNLDPNKDLAIDRDFLQAELADHPRMFAFYAQAHEKAEADVRDARYKRHCAIEDEEARLRNQYLTGRGGLSVEAMKKKINRARKVRRAHEEVMAAEKVAAELKVYRDAFQQRYGMLRSLSNTSEDR